MLELSDKDFKIALITMHQNVRANIPEINEMIENFNKEKEDIKRNQMEITDLNNRMIEIKKKKSLDWA